MLPAILLLQLIFPACFSTLSLWSVLLQSKDGLLRFCMKWIHFPPEKESSFLRWRATTLKPSYWLTVQGRAAGHCNICNFPYTQTLLHMEKNLFSLWPSLISLSPVHRHVYIFEAEFLKKAATKMTTKKVRKPHGLDRKQNQQVHSLDLLFPLAHLSPSAQP